MNKTIIALFSFFLFSHLAFADNSCEAWAAEKKLEGAAKTWFVKKCKRVATEEALRMSCEAKATDQKLTGSAKVGFINKCVDSSRSAVRAEAPTAETPFKTEFFDHATNKTEAKQKPQSGVNTGAGSATPENIRPGLKLDTLLVDKPVVRGNAETDVKPIAESMANAKAGTPASETYREGLMREGNGDIANAMKSFQAAADAGYGPAMKRLSEIYDQGNSVVPHDYAAAVKWYNKAKQSGMILPYTIIKR